MIEARKCARCGSLYISNTEVCSSCQRKDGADLYKLKGFIENQGVDEPLTQGELAMATGILNKNLTRFLGYEEFQGVCAQPKAVAASAQNVENLNGGTEVV